MRHRLFAHVVWTTRPRAPILDVGIARFLDRFLRAIAREERAIVLELGIVRTHVHVLVRYHPMTDLTRLMQRLKGSSAAVANKERHSSTGAPLLWSKGYSIDAVSPRAITDARAYVRAQAEHHPELAIADWGGTESLPAAAEQEWVDANRWGLRTGPGSGQLHKMRRRA
jgi:REP element-mobilizing transposase RayT